MRRLELPERVILDQVIELSLRVDVRFDPESDQDRAATQYVAKGHNRTRAPQQIGLLSAGEMGMADWAACYCLAGPVPGCDEPAE
jgi:hypothetical protein